MSKTINSMIYDKILKEADIKEVISSYGLSIQKNKCLCPFHNDHNASLSIQPEKNIFTCFSCGEKGNVITFVEKYEKQVNHNNNFTRADAAKKVVEICNLKIDVSTLSSKEEKVKTDPKKQLIYDANLLAQKTFSYELENVKSANKARRYLGLRNITQTMIKKFDIGFANDKEIFSSSTNAENFKKAGLISEEYNRDIFNDRIMFPLADENGNIVGFSGRTIDSKNTVKYLNTGKTEAFTKGDILYNFHNAKKSAFNKELILVEGYMDVIGLDRLGIENAAALMGTALSNKQIAMIKRLNCRVNLMLDSDQPGKDATMKNIALLEKASIEVVVTDLTKVSSLKDIGEITEKARSEEYDQIRANLIIAKERPLEYKLGYFFNMQGVKENPSLLLIEDAYDLVKDSMHTTADQTVFIEYMNAISNYNKEAIESVISPKPIDAYNKLKEVAYYSYLLDGINSEVQAREDLIIKAYVEQNTKAVAEGVDKIIKEQPEFIGQGNLKVGEILDTYLNNDMQYQEFKAIHTFKHPTLFENTVYFEQEKLKNLSLSKTQKNMIVENFNALDDKIKDKYSHFSQVMVINKPEDLYSFLPTKLLNPIQFMHIQRNLLDQKMTVVDLNTIFDVDLIQNGLFNYFDDSYKDQNGKLKTVLLYPNLENSLGINTKKDMKKEKQITQDINIAPIVEKTREQEINMVSSLDKENAELDKQINFDKEYLSINIAKSLVDKTTKNGFYLKSPKNKDIHFFIKKDKILDDKANYYTVKVEGDMGSVYTYQNQKYVFDHKILLDDIKENFNILSNKIKENPITKVSNEETIKLKFKKQNVEFMPGKNGKHWAKISFPYKNDIGTFYIQSKHVKEYGDSLALDVKPTWQFKVRLENGKTEMVSALEIEDNLSLDRAPVLETNIEHEYEERGIV